MEITLNQIIRLTDRMYRTFSTSAPPIIVHSRREAVKAGLTHRLNRRSLSRVYKQITGESLLAVHRRKMKRGKGPS